MSTNSMNDIKKRLADSKDHFKGYAFFGFILLVSAIFLYFLIFQWTLIYKNSKNSYELAYPLKHQTIGGGQLVLQFDKLRYGAPEDLTIWVNNELAYSGETDKKLETDKVSNVYLANGQYEIIFNYQSISEGDKVRVSSARYDQNQVRENRWKGQYLNLNHTWVYTEKTLPPIRRIEKVGLVDIDQPRYEVQFNDNFNEADIVKNYDLYTSEAKPSCEDCEDKELMCLGPKNKLKSVVTADSKSLTMTLAVDERVPRSKNATCVYLVPTHSSYLDNNWRGAIEKIVFKSAEAHLELGEVFDPEQEFYSFLNIDFDTPMYSDIDADEDAEDFMNHRIQQKEKLIESIQVSPKAVIDMEKTFFSPYKAMVAVRLQPKTAYELKILGMKDGYNQKMPPAQINVEIGDQEYLALKFARSESIYQNSTPPRFKYVQYEHPTSSVKLCRIGIEEYAKIENIYNYRTDVPSADDFFINGIDDLKSIKCFSKKINVGEDEYVSEFGIDDLIGSPASSGLYYMTLQDPEDRQVATQKPSYPLFFSIVDSHLTMKVSENGQALFWVNDFENGNGIAGLEIKAYKADFRDYEENWNSETNEYNRTYFNPLDGVFNEGVVLGKTDSNGFLEAEIPEEFNPYYSSLNTRSWYSDGARAILVTADSSEHLTYVSDQWNDGIARWNFGYYPAGQYYYGEEEGVVGKDLMAHTFTDRKLYLPGETVHLKSVIRELDKTLSIPNRNKEFTLKVSDSFGKLIVEKNYRVNDFGSIFHDLVLPEESPLGTYNVILSPKDELEYIDNTTFNVEEFKKPTFKVEVHLDSPDVKENLLIDPKKDVEKTDWGYSYSSYSKDIKINTKVNANYYSGGSVRNADYEYKVYRQYYYEPYFWNDCFWGCYWEPEKEFITSGEGTLSGAGDASVSIPVSYYSSWDDYKYIVEITVKDENGERITGANSILIKRPSDSAGNPNIKAKLSIDTQFAKKGENLSIKVLPDKKWNEKAHQNQYFVKVSRKVYSTSHKKNTEGRLVPQVDFELIDVWKKDLNGSEFKVTDNGLVQDLELNETGEWLIELYRSADSEYVETSETVYVYDEGISNIPVVDDNKIKVLSEKAIYQLGDTARFLVRLPFDNARLLVTTEKIDVVDRQVIEVPGNAYLYEVKVDDTFVPNGYLSFIAFQKGGHDYKVGYSEIVVDQSEKKLMIESVFNKEEYRPRDTVTLNLSTQDKSEGAISSELMVAVVDESLISLLGNIDMDILKKFYRKIAFQTDTSLTSVAMLNQIFFSRKGLVGGSGDKGGDDSVFTRSLFKNTAYYNGSVITDKSGKATVKFDLPDNIGDFRLIVLGSTKNGLFGGYEKTFSVRQDLVIEDAFPLIFRQGDQMQLGANVFNHTEEPMQVEMNLKSDELMISNESQSVTVKPQDRLFVKWEAQVKNQPNETVNYVITAREKNGESDQIKKSVPIASSPLIASYNSYRDSFVDNSNFEINYKSVPNEALSYVQMSVSRSLLSGIDKIVSSLLAYPHGCLEQTTSTTLPNAILLKFSNLITLDLDRSVIQENLKAGVDRIFGMQQEDGGFGYWPGDRTTSHHYSPYAIWALATMKELGADVNSENLKKAENYLIDRFKNAEMASVDISEYAAALSALAKLKSNYFSTARDLVLSQQKKFTFHENLFYTLALTEYDKDRYLDEIKKQLASITIVDESSYAYWDKTTYQAILAQLLIQVSPDSEKTTALIKDLYDLNFSSYYYSTQTKAQAFIAFAQFIEKENQLAVKDPVAVTYRVNGKVGSFSLTADRVFQKKKIAFNEFKSLTDQSFDFSVETNDGNEKKVYLDVDVVVYPKDLKDVPAESNGATIKREIYSVNGDKQTLIKNNQLKLGEQYLMKLKYKFDNRQRDVAIEDHLPGGIQVLNESFKTTSADADRGWWDYFNHIEYKRNMVFAVASWMDADQWQEFNYFFTPIIEGQFTLPPVSIFPMYQPFIEGHTGYEKLSVIK